MSMSPLQVQNLKSGNRKKCRTTSSDAVNHILHASIWNAGICANTPTYVLLASERGVCSINTSIP